MAVCFFIYGLPIFSEPKERIGFVLNVLMLAAALGAFTLAVSAVFFAWPGYRKALSDLDDLQRQNWRRQVPIQAEIEGDPIFYSGLYYYIVSVKGDPRQAITLQEARVEVVRRKLLPMDSEVKSADLFTSETVVSRLLHPLYIEVKEQYRNSVSLAVIEPPFLTKKELEDGEFEYVQSEEIELKVYVKVSNGVREEVVFRRGFVEMQPDGIPKLERRQGTIYNSAYGISEDVSNYMNETIINGRGGE